MCAGDKYGNGLNLDAQDDFCEGFTCTGAADAATCCQLSATCLSLNESESKVRSVCREFGLKGGADEIYCAGTSCGLADKMKCCKSPPFCSSLKTSDEIQGLCGEGRYLINAASSTRCKGGKCGKQDEDTCCAPLEPCPLKVCTCSDGTAATGDDCIYDKSEHCMSCDKNFFLQKYRKGLASCKSCPEGLCQDYNFFTGPTCNPCKCIEGDRTFGEVFYYVEHQIALDGMDADTFNTNANVVTAFSKTVAYLLGVPADSLQNVKASAGNSDNKNGNDIESDDNKDDNNDDDNNDDNKNNNDQTTGKNRRRMAAHSAGGENGSDISAGEDENDGANDDSDGGQDGACIVDYEIVFDSQEEANAASETIENKNALFSSPDVFASVFKAEMKETGTSDAVVDAVKGASPSLKVVRAELTTRDASDKDDDEAAAIADDVPAFSGGTFVGGIMLGMGLCAILGGLVWLKRSRVGDSGKTSRSKKLNNAKQSMNTFGLPGGQTELTEITIGNKKMTNPAFGHSKKLAAAVKKKKRKSQKVKAQQPVGTKSTEKGDLQVHEDAYGRRYTFNATTNETKWLVDAVAPPDPNVLSTPGGATQTQGAGEEKEKVDVLTDAQGRRYTYNHKSGESAWLED